MSLPTINDLAQRYAEERYFGDDRTAAQYAYALALRFQEVGAKEEARYYATECLRLTEILSAASLDEVTCVSPTIGGIPMPELFHDGVVRARLGGLLLNEEDQERMERG